ncbi:hypothetical protein Tco_1410090 [Tanacetum coccineum]
MWTGSRLENAVLDLGVVNPLCLFLFSSKELSLSFITELINVHSVELFIGHPAVFRSMFCHVQGSSRLCVLTQLADGKLFRRPAYMEYTRWVFCKRCGKPQIAFIVPYLTMGRFSLLILSRILFKPRLDTSLVHLFVV